MKSSWVFPAGHCIQKFPSKCDVSFSSSQLFDTEADNIVSRLLQISLNIRKFFFDSILAHSLSFKSHLNLKQLCCMIIINIIRNHGPFDVHLLPWQCCKDWVFFPLFIFCYLNLFSLPETENAGKMWWFRLSNSDIC